PPARTRELTDAVIKLAGGRLCSPTTAQYAIQPALQGDRPSINTFKEEIRKRRDLAAKRVARIDGLSCSLPEAAFYLMIKVEDMGDRLDEQFVLDLLEASNGLVLHGSGFGRDPRAGYFRMVYLADEKL